MIAGATNALHNNGSGTHVATCSFMHTIYIEEAFVTYVFPLFVLTEAEG